MTDSLKELRQQWLKAAEIYYLGYGDVESDMSDYQWDKAGRLLDSFKNEFPDCPIINHEKFEGGQSLFWVDWELYHKAKELYK